VEVLTLMRSFILRRKGLRLEVPGEVILCLIAKVCAVLLMLHF
jgi:hypothetical protein